MNEKQKITVGYWATTKEDDSLPFPEDSGKSVDFKFLKKLLSLEAKLILENGRGYVRYRGFSGCRLCNKSNGSAEFHYKNYIWPSGYKHYLTEHNVQPPQHFVDFINDNS